MKNMLLGLFLGKNGKASLTKTCAWLLGLSQAAQTLFPGLISPEVLGTVQGLLVAIGGVGVKNAIDKTAPKGTVANPHPE